LEAQSMAEINCFAFHPLLSIPKVESQEKTKLILTTHRIPNTKLKNSKHGPHNFFALFLLLLMSKVED
jgi:hypothetical protein